MKHLRYLKYVLRHKYFVFIGGVKLNVSLWQLLIHDWTKFLPIEWRGYVERMELSKNSTWQSADDTDLYRIAWRHHWSSNPHHWQHWVFDGVAREMPEKYVREMVADWYGAGHAQGKPNIKQWWETTQDRRILHPATHQRVVELMSLL